MAFCGLCGFENPDGARFCGSCGADLTQQEVGNVETIVNESAGTATADNNPMAYVPLDTPSVEEAETSENTVEEGDAAPQTETETNPPEITSYTPKPPTYTPEPVAPTPPPAPQPPVTPPPPPTPQPVAPAPLPLRGSGGIQTPPPTPQPTPQKSGSNGSKTCLGCGCAAAIVFLLIIGGLCWWIYDYIKKQDLGIDETLEWLDQSHKEWEDKRCIGEQNPDEQIYNGKSLRELAEELDFPVVNYGELPKEGRVYRGGEDAYTIKFTSINFTEGDYIGTLTAQSESGTKVEFWVSPCGCSIYHLSNPNDESVECGYLFVYEKAKRILVNNEGDLLEFTLPNE